MNHPFLFLRSLVFYMFYTSFTTIFITSALFFIWFLPFRAKFWYMTRWNHVTIFMAKLITGIRYKVTGLENIPKDTNFVVLSKHQSQWETFFLLTIFCPISIILKKELLSLPGFGLGLRLIKPIPIDRKNPKQALKLIQSQGLIRLLEDKIPILIFPEGTRIPAGEVGKYARSGASLAISANVPIICISHNAGYFWPADGFLKTPGTVEMFISKPIYPEGKTALQLTNEAEEWIEAHIKKPA